MNILFESKKDIIKKLKNKHPDNEEFIDRMFSIDPTSQGKYAEWIGKYLEQSFKSKMITKNEIEGMITKIIIPFEKNHNRINKNIIEQFENKLIDSGVKLEGENLADVEKIKKHPKDINSYSMPFYIITMLQVLEENKTRLNKERLAKKGVDKIFEDSNYLVVRPLTYEASCYYGRNTKWCTASTKTSSNYDKYSKDGFLYYFIDKKHPNDKVALYLEKSGNKLLKYVYDSIDVERGIDFLYDQFPELSGLIDEITLQAPIVSLLRKYKEGSGNASQILNSDIITDIIKNEKNRGESLVKISFDGLDDYKNVIDLDDDDKWFLGMIDNPYTDYEFYSMDGRDEWGGGYIIRNFNKENLELLNEILKYISPENVNIDLTDNDDAAEKVAELLDDMFESEVSDIIYDYQHYMNEAAEIGAKEQVKDDLCDFFNEFGIIKSSDECFETYETTIDNLIYLFDEYKPKKQTIKNLLRLISEDKHVGGWMYNTYEMINWDAFDEESFQKSVNSALEKIKETIEENENFDEYNYMFNEITKKYEIQKWYLLPRNKDILFRINFIRLDDLVISLTTKSNMGFTTHILDNVDDFYSFLYNYKLFDDY